MYDQYATLLRAADAGYLAGNHRLTAPRAHRVASGERRRGLTRRHGHTRVVAAPSRGTVRTACAGADATAR
jgi:hypothetical protein